MIPPGRPNSGRRPIPPSSHRCPGCGTICHQTLRPACGCHQPTRPRTSRCECQPLYLRTRWFRRWRTSKSIHKSLWPPTSVHPGLRPPSSTGAGSPPRSNSSPCPRMCRVNPRTPRPPSCAHRQTWPQTSTIHWSPGRSSWCRCRRTHTPDLHWPPQPSQLRWWKWQSNASFDRCRERSR